MCLEGGAGDHYQVLIQVEEVAVAGNVESSLGESDDDVKMTRKSTCGK